MKFNSLQNQNFEASLELKNYQINVLSQNENLEHLRKAYKKVFNKNKIKNISFSIDGFFSLILSLKGKIAVSLGESEYIVAAANRAKEFGQDIEFLTLNKDGSVNSEILDDSFDFVFISSYVMDTYVKTDLKKIKEKTSAKIISNATANKSDFSDIYLLDSFKLCSMGEQGVLIYNDEFAEANIASFNLVVLDMSLKAYENRKTDKNTKTKVLEEFKKIFKDDIYFFVKPQSCLEYTLHLGLKDIKMRELIRTLVFEDIYITNGEGCSLGLSRPSRIIQDMGFNEEQSRWSMSLDFSEELSQEKIEKLVDIIYKKYKQIKVLG